MGGIYDIQISSHYEHVKFVCHAELWSVDKNEAMLAPIEGLIGSTTVNLTKLYDDQGK